jgi:hypothetical protein
MTGAADPPPPLRLLVPSRDIERRSLDGSLAVLMTLTADGATAAVHQGRITLEFEHSWPEPGPLFMQPAARDWFAALTHAWPYWSFFASRDDTTITHVLTLLLPGRVIHAPDGRAGWKFELDELQPLLVRLLGAQAALVHRLGIDPELHDGAIETFFAAARNVIR